MKILSFSFISLLSCALITSCNSGTQEKQTKAEPTATNQNPEIEQISAVINGHEYHYDVVTGATKEVKKTDTDTIAYEEKIKKMFWSGKPALGYIEGDYYSTDTLFGGYLALIEVVKKGDKLQLVEFDEVGPDDYYAPEWAGKSKRLSGYGFFQAKSQRTENTLVTLINGLTYLEHQMLSENRLTGDFKSLKGSSNSVRRAFIPATARLAEQTNAPSGKYYYGLAKDLGGGVIGRIEVVKEGDKIAWVKYDEIFEDNMEDIKDTKLQQFYRQSKYESPIYQEVMGVNFKAFADEISASVVASQDLLKLSSTVKSNKAFKGELANYESLANELLKNIKK